MHEIHRGHTLTNGRAIWPRATLAAVLALLMGLALLATPATPAGAQEPSQVEAAQSVAPELADVTVSRNQPVAPVNPPPGEDAPGRVAGGLQVNPEDPDHWVAFTWNMHVDAGDTCELHVSRDGGATWSTTNDFPAPPDFGGEPEGNRGFCSNERGSNRHSSHGSIAFGEGDTVYTTFLGVREGAVGTSLLLARSDDGGDTITSVVEAIVGGVAGPEDEVTGIINPQHPSFNFPRVAVDPGAGVNGEDLVYVQARGSIAHETLNTWTESNIALAVSHDGGDTFSHPVAVNRVDQGPTDDPADFTGSLQGEVRIAADGTAYTTWQSGNEKVRVGWTTDEGATWQVADVVDVPRGNSYPRIDVADDTGHVYITYLQDPTPIPPPEGLGADEVGAQDHWFDRQAAVYVTKSTNGGQDWTTPIKVNDPLPAESGVEVHQIRFPHIEVSPSGRVDVVWFDRRHWIEGRGSTVDGGQERPGHRDTDICIDSHAPCTEARTSDIYYSFSEDGGATFSTDHRVTDHSNNDEVGWEFNIGPFWHHGMTLTHEGDVLVPAWSDSRRAQALPGGVTIGTTGPEMNDLFFARVSHGNDPDALPVVDNVPADNVPDLSVAMSRLGYPGGEEGRLTGNRISSPFTHAVIVNEDDWAAALVGSVLARRYMGPVLATPAGALPASVSEEIDRLDLWQHEQAPNPIPEGTDTSQMVHVALGGAFILGDAAEVSAPIQTDLEDRDIAVERIDQGNIGMAALVARHLDDRFDREKDPTNEAFVPAFDAVVIVNPTDEESAGVAALAAGRRLPVLFTSPDGSLPAATQDALDDLDIERTVVVGDEAAVTPATFGALPGPERVTGADVFDTSAAIVEESHDRAMPTNILYVVGDDPMHAALAGSPVARAGGILVQAPAAHPQDAMDTMEAAGLANHVDRIVRFGADVLAPVWGGDAELTVSDITQTSVTLSWPGATDDSDVTGYHLYQDGVFIEDLEGSPLPTSHTVTGLTPGTSYTFTLEAHDAEGNESEDGPSATVTTLDDTVIPPEDLACDPDLVPAPPFTDITGNTHFDNIACIVWFGLTQGTTPTTYSPANPVRRDQMASFIARLLETAGVTLPAPSDQGFGDIAGNVHADRINQLAALDVVLGTSATTYAPSQEVRRDQMASFLVRAYELIDGSPLPREASPFTDVAGNTHLANIEKAATAGFTQGTTPTTYSPSASVRRDQMGSFLARVLNLGMEDGHVTHPSS